MLISSILDKEQHNYVDDELIEKFKPKVLMRYSRGKTRFNLQTKKSLYDKFNFVKAAKCTIPYRNRCVLCKIWKNNFSAMFYHIVSVDHNVSSFEIKNALEQKEKESLEFQLSIKRNQN